MRFDPRLYVILDMSVVHDPPAETVTQLVDGGATLIQLRCKLDDTRHFYEHAVAVRLSIQNPDVRLIINDRVDIAMAIDADGVHLGAEDLSVRDARRLMGPDKIIGASANTIDEAMAAQSQGASYLGVGTVFPTRSKSNIKSIIGIEGLKEIIARVSIPVVAIGGISASSIPDIFSAGASGIAVISAVFGDNAPQSRVRELRHRIENTVAS